MINYDCDFCDEKQIERVRMLHGKIDDDGEERKVSAIIDVRIERSDGRFVGAVLCGKCLRGIVAGLIEKRKVKKP